MKERISEGLKTNIHAKYFYYDKLRSGIITNLSEKAMYIKTNPCFPCVAIFEVLIPSENEILKVPVKVLKIHKEGNDYVGMSVEIVEQTEKYLNFVNTLKLAIVN
jgi:hypothetical protein